MTKPTKWHVCQWRHGSAWASAQSDQKIQISLGICPVWSEDTDQPGHLPSLIRVFAVSMKKAWVWSVSMKKATHWATSKDSDKTGWMPRLIWVIPGCSHFVSVFFSWGSLVLCVYILEKTNQGLHCLPFLLHLLVTFVYSKTRLFKFWDTVMTSATSRNSLIDGIFTVMASCYLFSPNSMQWRLAKSKGCSTSMGRYL